METDKSYAERSTAEVKEKKKESVRKESKQQAIESINTRPQAR